MPDSPIPPAAAWSASSASSHECEPAQRFWRLADRVNMRLSLNPPQVAELRRLGLEWRRWYYQLAAAGASTKAEGLRGVAQVNSILKRAGCSV